MHPQASVARIDTHTPCCRLTQIFTFRVISQIDVNKLKGTVVAVPCVNVWGFLKFQREFADGRDLNRQFPGKSDGYASQVFCDHLMNKIISQFNYMVDLHTASFGRINSYYVRADMVCIYHWCYLLDMEANDVWTLLEWSLGRENGQATAASNLVT